MTFSMSTTKQFYFCVKADYSFLFLSPTVNNIGTVDYQYYQRCQFAMIDVKRYEKIRTMLVRAHGRQLNCVFHNLGSLSAGDDSCSILERVQSSLFDEWYLSPSALKPNPLILSQCTIYYIKSLTSLLPVKHYGKLSSFPTR